jgi:hypothetical protein
MIEYPYRVETNFVSGAARARGDGHQPEEDRNESSRRPPSPRLDDTAAVTLETTDPVRSNGSKRAMMSSVSS